MPGFGSAYGLFLADFVTVMVVLGGMALLLLGLARHGGGRGEGLEVKHLNRGFEEDADVVRRAVHGPNRFKKLLKARTKERKKEEKKDRKNEQRGKDEGARGRIFVLDFKGDLRATATASLRREVTAVLGVAAEGDRVLVRLENAGGTVHEHGLAASQLLRIKHRRIPLIVAVDKVAASGGYLMATVADRILAAPFAIIGSIGVLAQLPNFHRLLERSGIDYEQITAGRFKRTLTLFGENTDEDREKLRAELGEVHALFKRQIAEHRTQVDVDAVATGEHWYGSKALELKLVDELATSDDFLLEAAKDCDLYLVAYKRRRRWQERLFGSAESLLSRRAL
ncbi:MAG TPA: protease SohB [Gammaproteobacteria bacterium]|nr:protease SohB [Gammaproteobacteria bacterium]